MTRHRVMAHSYYSRGWMITRPPILVTVGGFLWIAWFRTFLTLDPRAYLKKLAVPVLAVIGERDLQVLPGANLPQLRQALRDNPDVTIRELPGLNPLFQTCKTGLPAEYATIDETMSPTVLT